MIDAPQGDTFATQPFRLWPAQVWVLWQLLVERLAIILKARQLGISWLVCGYALWLCLFKPGRLVLLFSKGQLEANELARRVSAMYSRLPPWMRARLPRLITDNTTEVEWANGSRVQSLPATQSAGRSFTASLVVMDEAAFMQWADKLYGALKPTIDGGGQLIVLSTANGRSNMFARLWDRACKALNNFKSIFLPWWSDPRRTSTWYADTARDAIDQSIMDQEYPARPEDAFSASEAAKFVEKIWWDHCREILPGLDAHTPVVIALDAGVKNDSFGVAAVSRHPADSRRVAVRYAREWKPRKGGGAIDFDGTDDEPGPLREVERLCNQFNVVEITYDPYQLVYAAKQLREKGLAVMREFPQGDMRLEADSQWRYLILNRLVSHDGNEAMTQHVDNANAKIDSEGRKLRIVKREDALKVDLCVCGSMASYRCLKLPLD